MKKEKLYIRESEKDGRCEWCFESDRGSAKCTPVPPARKARRKTLEQRAVEYADRLFGERDENCAVREVWIDGYKAARQDARRAQR